MTDSEKVRLLINDKVVPYHFTDVEIAAFLEMAEDSVYLAAAMALEAWAAALSESADSEKIGDYSYSKKAADNKLKLAERYRQQAEAVPIVTWAEMNFTGVEETE